MPTEDVEPDCRAVYVGTGLKPKFMIIYADERTWRQRLTTEIEDICRPRRAT